jgi:hypothetical protein
MFTDSRLESSEPKVRDEIPFRLGDKKVFFNLFEWTLHCKACLGEIEQYNYNVSLLALLWSLGNLGVKTERKSLPRQDSKNVCVMLVTSVADPGSGIRNWVLFDPWIRDPE